MSHELRTPLNAIIGFSKLIAQEIFGPISEPKYIEFARGIHSAGQRALNVFLDVQTMAELEAEEQLWQSFSRPTREWIAKSSWRRTGPHCLSASS